MGTIRKEIKDEVLKREKDGLDVLADIGRFAKGGFASIPPDDLARLKWFGVYTQRPQEAGYFMLRVKVPAGQLTSVRAREIGAICKQYARNVCDISTRQNIQMHWLQIENIPDVFSRLYDKVGMNQSFACGDTPRNVTSCPLAGVTADEYFNAWPYAEAVADMYYRGGKEFSNLPRKFKTSISACRLHCNAPQINCVGLFGVERKRQGGVERGFGLLIGGGLRDTPHFGQSLRVFIPQDRRKVLDVCRATALLFRDRQELRQGRLRARLKFYMAAAGWEAVRDELEKYLSFKLERDDEIVFPQGAAHNRDHIGVGAQQQEGLCYVGIPIERGRISGDQLVTLGELSEKYAPGGGRVVTTIKQNIVLTNIPKARVDDLVKELTDLDLSPHRHALRTSLLSCTGIEFCKLAVVETKQRAKEILNYLEGRLDLDESFFISVTGCPNSCAQYQISDIGLHGVPTKYKGEKVDGYYVLIGARLGVDPKFAEFINGPNGKRFKVPSSIIHEAIERVLRAYMSERNGEQFTAWARKQDNDRLAELLWPEGVAEEKAALAAAK